MYFRPFMVTVKPFAALRPRPELAAQICELPYDVMSSDEARQIAAGNPLSFLHVSKPEIDLPPDTDPYAPEVYAKGRENFSRFIAQGAIISPSTRPVSELRTVVTSSSKRFSSSSLVVTSGSR